MYENNLIKSIFAPQNMQNMLLSELYALYNQHPAIVTDSRKCLSNSIFFALKGEAFDGNTFAKNTLQSGCAYAVIDNASYLTDKRMILVDDVLSTLQQLACLHRKSFGVPVIGITGTNGKTTTKELTAAVLSKKYNVLFTQGNLNNHIGVPLTLLRLTSEHEIAIIEMGANHHGEIRSLANIAQPDYGLITNVGYAHLEGFGSIEGVISTKGELYDFLRKSGGKVFINNDDSHLTRIAEGIEQITYGMASGTNNLVSGRVINCNPFLSFEWQQRHNHLWHTVDTNLVGDYNIYNALAAISIGINFNITPELINNAIADYAPENNRSQLKKTAYNTIILDSYNANPSSMRAALNNFTSSGVIPETATHSSNPDSSPAPLPKAIILGDMLELGNKSAELHDDIVKLIEKSGIRKVLLCGEQFSATGKSFSCFPSVVNLIEFLKKEPLQGYNILIKGSHGMHLERIIDFL